MCATVSITSQVDDVALVAVSKDGANISTIGSQAFERGLLGSPESEWQIHSRYFESNGRYGDYHFLMLPRVWPSQLAAHKDYFVINLCGHACTQFTSWWNKSLLVIMTKQALHISGSSRRKSQLLYNSYTYTVNSSFHRRHCM